MKKEILIVEDEALIALSLKERIESFGYKVSGIIDRGEDVIPNILLQRPDLILMDINLKGKQDGIETAEMLNKQDNVPIIFLTSYSNQSVIERAKKTSPFGYVIKTVDDNNLHISIDIALNKHQSFQKESTILEKKIKKLRSLYDHNPNMVIRFSKNKKIEYVNPNFCQNMGLKAREIEGKKLASIHMNDETIQLFSNIINEVLGKKQKLFMEVQLPTFMGNRYMYVNGLPEMNENGKVDTVLFVLRDDTDQKIAADTILAKQKKISESINYSMQIQSSIFPQMSLLTSYFKDSFIINKPKDKIGGDFPWVNRVGNSVYVAAVDCTGHGVPGALMSLVTYFLIDKINSISKDVPPGMMLDFLHVFVNRALKQHYHDSKSNDGADISLCKIDIHNRVLEYAGAHRPLFLQRKGDLIEIKGDKFPIGGMQYRKRNRFNTHRVDLMEDDIIFQFSDGLQDQFGIDEDGQLRKFGLKRIREVLLQENVWEIDNLSTALSSRLKSWMGPQKQLDDILAIGIKV